MFGSYLRQNSRPVWMNEASHLTFLYMFRFLGLQSTGQVLSDRATADREHANAAASFYPACCVTLLTEVWVPAIKTTIQMSPSGTACARSVNKHSSSVCTKSLPVFFSCSRSASVFITPPPHPVPCFTLNQAALLTAHSVLNTPTPAKVLSGFSQNILQAM